MNFAMRASLKGRFLLFCHCLPQALMALLALGPLVLLSGCAVPQAKPIIDPTIVSTSYDYTKPADIAAQSKPVWILPVINKGWVPAHIDPRTGDWLSGHYQATIVQDGYWATQEEAELAGRPYIVAGDSSPIIPRPVTDGPTRLGTGSPEVDLTALQNKVRELEQKQRGPMEINQQSPDKLAALSAQVQAMAIDIPNGGQSMATPAGQLTTGYNSPFQVDVNQPPPPTPPYPYGTPQYGAQYESYQPYPTYPPQSMMMQQPWMSGPGSSMPMQPMPMQQAPMDMMPSAPSSYPMYPAMPQPQPNSLSSGSSSTRPNSWAARDTAVPVINVRPVQPQPQPQFQ